MAAVRSSPETAPSPPEPVPPRGSEPSKVGRAWRARPPRRAPRRQPAPAVRAARAPRAGRRRRRGRGRGALTQMGRPLASAPRAGAWSVRSGSRPRPRPDPPASGPHWRPHRLSSSRPGPAYPTHSAQLPSAPRTCARGPPRRGRAQPPQGYLLGCPGVWPPRCPIRGPPLATSSRQPSSPPPPLDGSRCQSRCPRGESPLAASGSSKYRQVEGEREGEQSHAGGEWK